MADYVPDNLSREAFSNLGTLYRRQKADGKWDENAPWRSIADDYSEQRIIKDTIFIESERYSLKGYVPGTDATSIAPQGGLRISFAELGHALEMLMNGGTYHGRQVLQPTSVAEIFRPRWIYDPVAKNGETYDGTMLAYGLGLYPVYGDSTGRVCRDHVINLVGHTGGMFFRPGTRDGFLYAINGLGIEPDEDPRSVGKFSGNYIWEEKIMDAVCRALWGEEFPKGPTR